MDYFSPNGFFSLIFFAWASFLFQKFFFYFYSYLLSLGRVSFCFRTLAWLLFEIDDDDDDDLAFI